MKPIKTKMATTELEEFFQQHGFQVYLTDQDDVQCAEVESWTDGGVDMIIWLNPFTKEEFIQYVENFDIDEEITINRQNELYCDNFTIAESVKDFTTYHNGLKNIAHILEYGEPIQTVKCDTCKFGNSCVLNPIKDGKFNCESYSNKMESWLDQLLPIIEEYKDGSNEPLDGDEVDDLVKITKAKINLQEGNITLEEYEAILG
jgi:hypothetical protein